jgi:hypothetical protein
MKTEMNRPKRLCLTCPALQDTDQTRQKQQIKHAARGRRVIFIPRPLLFWRAPCDFLMSDCHRSRWGWVCCLKRGAVARHQIHASCCQSQESSSFPKTKAAVRDVQVHPRSDLRARTNTKSRFPKALLPTIIFWKRRREYTICLRGLPSCP